ncbi:DUF1572 family protein [Pseudotenacibaculum sp. MALMAid0570]|uniref:DUF1572 family protein n=1 Tax=Pseudotenacibaculum sp. MALMAid0570 TaxID=3143938 RepID=UPI0032DF57C5
MENSYLPSIVKQFQYYKNLGDKTFLQLSENELFWQSDSEANSVAIIVKHMVGNMLSRWTNFLTEDGEKPWRNRDDEFIGSYKTKEDVLMNWDKGWNCLFEALDQVNNQNLESIVYIRNQGHTITEALNRQLCHYSYHVGQIVFLGRMLKKEDWNSLSVAKNASKQYNSEKFSKEKSRKHFTDDL